VIQPTRGRVLVTRMPEPKPESELIIIPETVSQRPSCFAVVIAVGELKQGGIEAGDTVILTHYSGAPCSVEIDGDFVDAAIVPEEDVLAVVED